MLGLFLLPPLRLIDRFRKEPLRNIDTDLDICFDNKWLPSPVLAHRLVLSCRNKG